MPWVLLIVLSLIWGSSFILIKRGLDVYTPGQVAALRIIIAGALVLPLTFVQLRNTPRELLKYVALVGVLGNGIPAYLFSLAETQLNSSTAGILNALQPLFTLLIGAFVFHVALTRLKMAGVLIGLVGAVLLTVQNGGTGEPAQNLLYGLLVIAATIMYATSVNIIRYKLQSLRAIQITSLALPIIAAPYLLYLFTTDFTERFTSVPGAAVSLGYIAILASLGTTFSVILFNKLIQTSGPLFASSVTYIIPIVALAWGVADGEPLGLLHIVGMGAILAGVYVVNRVSATSAVK
jgi:drug/metabolite transporter (DMT)-like permease